ncbi:class I SAM-dependent methyltransferase [Pseudodesulfovibrio profundus]|uniref:class I SAM-dependent methyltransferase n=1 Tax=Pseudodesulfovibrio profundus TaxID=57320 RepID=UPI0012FFBE16|nr:class I SAM-dependent methyltransferase [Pseudodesulfovibrio profundus]
MDRIKKQGFLCSFSGGKVEPGLFNVQSANYREDFLYNGLNSRLRAVICELNKVVAEKGDNDIRIYAPEAVTPFALLLRGRYPRFLGSEYSDDQLVRDGLFPILCEDLLSLSFSDSAFDVVVINDVFEHVPDIDKCLEELARVIVPGGKLISTFPFNMGADESVVKARLTDSGIEHLTEPEYHGNPVDPQGSLVFEIPGWDILGRAQAAGWRKVEIVYHHSAKYGIISNGFSGIFTLVAEK